MNKEKEERRGLRCLSSRRF